MSDHRPFRVCASVLTPVIISPKAYLTLDAVTLFLMTARGMDFSQAQAALPLSMDGAVPCASAAFFDLASAAHVDRVGWKRSVPLREEASENFTIFGKGRNSTRPVKRPSVDQKRGEYASILTSYTSLGAQSVEWYGRGDIDMMRDLFLDLHAVGKKCRQGFGRIDGVTVEEVEIDLSLARGEPGKEQPMRPIPFDQWAASGRQTGQVFVANLSSSAPYFMSNPVRCVAPKVRVKTWN